LTGGGGDAAAEASSTPAVTGGDSAPVAAAPAAAPAKVTPTEPAFIEPVDKAAFQRVEAIRTRRIPAWAMSVLAIIPVWGFLYIGAFGERAHHEEVIDGGTIYANSCASCHGANGGGGVGPKLSGGDAILTFPGDTGRDDHIAWVTNGSAAAKGQGYGDPNRTGGQRVATSGGMPPFGGQLSPEEIEAVVDYERDGL